MNKLEIQLKNKIMRRVYVAWFLKRFFSVATLRFVVLFSLFVEFLREVSVSSVIGNLPGRIDLLEDFNYLATAFSQTEASVQIYLSGILMIFFWLTFEKFKNEIPFLGIKESKL
ncbi:MAG: hypothetical protein WCO84_05355 [bacterium]